MKDDDLGARMTRTILAQDVNGHGELTGAGLAIILGVTLEELALHYDPTPGSISLPKEWQSLLQRRVREAQASVGSKDLGAVLMYYAFQHYGDGAVEFDFDEQTGSLWMLTEDVSP